MSELDEAMSRLEERYRLLLRVLPADYRATWQEEMVTTFLASMHTDDAEEADYLANYGRPSWPEMASVVTLAVGLRLRVMRLRLGGTGAPPRNALWGNAVRLMALIGLLVHATFAVTGLALALWVTGKLPWLPAPPFVIEVMVPIDPWQKVGAVASLVWLPAYLALLFGQRRAAHVLVVLAAATILIAGSRLFEPSAPFALTDVAYHVFGALPVLALAAFHRDAPPVKVRPWLLAVPISIAIEAGLLFVTVPADLQSFPLLDWPAMYCLALVIAAAVVLVRHGDPSWSLALALLAPSVLGIRAVTLFDVVQMAPAAQQPALLTLGLIEVGAALVMAVAMAIRAGKALRRMPATA